MALKEKFLILWILGAILLAFLASHAMAIVVAGFENACAFRIVPAVLVNVVAAFASCSHS
jgi:hypothetical protein